MAFFTLYLYSPACEWFVGDNDPTTADRADRNDAPNISHGQFPHNSFASFSQIVICFDFLAQSHHTIELMEQPAGNEPAESPPARAASDAEHHIGQTEANEKPEVQAAGRHVDKPEKTNDGLNKPRIRVETRAGGSRYWVRRPRALQ